MKTPGGFPQPTKCSCRRKKPAGDFQQEAAGFGQFSFVTFLKGFSEDRLIISERPIVSPVVRVLRLDLVGAWCVRGRELSHSWREIRSHGRLRHCAGRMVEQWRMKRCRSVLWDHRSRVGCAGRFAGVVIRWNAKLIGQNLNRCRLPWLVRCHRLVGRRLRGRRHIVHQLRRIRRERLLMLGLRMQWSQRRLRIVRGVLHLRCGVVLFMIVAVAAHIGRVPSRHVHRCGGRGSCRQ